MEESGSLWGLRRIAANGGGSPKKGCNTKSKLQGEWEKKQLCMFCFHYLPHKVPRVRAKGNAMNLSGPLGRQLHWLTVGESPAAAFSSHSGPHCHPLLLLLPKALAGVDTPCLAGTSAQHIQGEPSQISLCYFKPTKDAGPLPLSHKYLHSHACPGLLTNPPGDTGSQQGVEGQQSPAGREHSSKGASPTEGS